MKPLTIEEFCQTLIVEFDELDPTLIHPGARLIADLNLDSLQLIRLAAVVESLAPIRVPTDLDLADVAIADIHYYYEVQATSLEN